MQIKYLLTARNGITRKFSAYALDEAIAYARSIVSDYKRIGIRNTFRLSARFDGKTQLVRIMF